MAVRDAGTRQDTFVLFCTLVFGGRAYDMGIWDKRTGGAADSDDVKYHPGAMAQQVSLGGRAINDNVTIQRLYDRIDDHDQIQLLINARGKGRWSVSQRPMDQEGNPYGKAITWIGTLKRVLVPEPDSESTSAAMIEIEVSVSGPPAAL